jgi:hypothetical protein
MERVRSQDGHLATVRWRGVLPDSKGKEDRWVGVEWDDPTRGKHNGEFKGQKLFSITTPNSGSFLRESTVTFGVPLSDLLNDYLIAGSPSLSIDHSDLCSVGPLQELPDHVRMLNATSTMIGSFQFIWDLLEVAPHLERLVLARLHFADFPPPPKQYPLAEIILNGTNVQTDHIRLLSVAFPELKTVDVSFCAVPRVALVFTTVHTSATSSSPSSPRNRVASDWSRCRPPCQLKRSCFEGKSTRDAERPSRSLLLERFRPNPS